MEKPYRVTDDVFVLPSFVAVPSLGVLPVNAFVLKAREPVLVDTGIGNDRGSFLEALETVIDPKDLRWIWLTHDDADHTGSVVEVMAAAPRARLVTNALSALRMGSWWPLPMERVYALNSGESISVGDRTLTGLRPPLYDNPSATGFVDSKGNLFCADCFGAIIPSLVREAADIPEGALGPGMTTWASADSPWIHSIDPGKFNKALTAIRDLEAKVVLSSHLPPAVGMLDRLVGILKGAPEAQPFVAPNQVALAQMLGQA
jgi:flavorubredoxin